VISCTESNWSPAMWHYATAVTLYEANSKDGEPNTEVLDRVAELLSKIPDMMRKGKSNYRSSCMMYN